mgnify:CR=1 FL=1
MVMLSVTINGVSGSKMLEVEGVTWGSLKVPFSLESLHIA